VQKPKFVVAGTSETLAKSFSLGQTTTKRHWSYIEIPRWLNKSLLGVSLGVTTLAVGYGLSIAGTNAETAIRWYEIAAAAAVVGVFFWDEITTLSLRRRISATAILVLVILASVAGLDYSAAVQARNAAWASMVQVAAESREMMAAVAASRKSSLAPKTPAPEAKLTTEISPYLIYGNKKLEIHNAGHQNLYLWGFAYGDGHVSPDTTSALIVPGTFYFLAMDKLDDELSAKLNDGQDMHIPCRIFIATQDSEKKTIRCSLWARKNSGTLTIDTRIVNIVSGWKTGGS